MDKDFRNAFCRGFGEKKNYAPYSSGGRAWQKLNLKDQNVYQSSLDCRFSNCFVVCTSSLPPIRVLSTAGHNS